MVINNCTIMQGSVCQLNLQLSVQEHTHTLVRVCACLRALFLSVRVLAFA